MKSKKHKSEKGFTIVELMIALSVLATIILASAVVMIQVGNLYVKGVNASSLQNVNRSVVADIASALQFSGNKPYPCTPSICTAKFDGGTLTVDSFCIDTTRYSYVLGREQGTDSAPPTGQPATTNHVLWRDPMPNSGSCTPLDLSAPGSPSGSTNGYDMFPNHMRLTQFNITETPANSGVYTVTLGVAYGDSDLLTQNGSGKYVCKGGVGTQFCSISTISETVTRRVE